MAKSFISLNPFNEKIIKEFDFISQNQLDTAVQRAHAAQQQWAKLSVSQRVQPLLKLKELLLAQSKKLASLATDEMGKTFEHALGEVQKCGTLCDYYISEAENILKPTTHKNEKANVLYVYEPVGVVLGVFPWNFPYWQSLRSAIPAMVAGNAMLIKPAPNIPQCAIALQDILNDCGFPEYLVQTIFAAEQQIEHLIANDLIAAASLTGSEKAGAAVASSAAKHIKKTVLELGGSDPLILLSDVNLNEIIDQVVFARFQNNGQSCIAAKRFIVHESLKEEFLGLLEEKVANLTLGDPMLGSTQIGPLARKDLKEQLAQQVNDSVKAGANIFYQQKQIPANGYFYPPTILTNIPQDSPAAQQELFGPVLSVFTFSHLNEAIHLANNTRFGLGASIYTKNTELAIEMASQIHSGMVYINQLVKSDVRVPFGGVKKSGIGKELGDAGLKEFCNLKTIWF